MDANARHVCFSGKPLAPRGRLPEAFVDAWQIRAYTLRQCAGPFAQQLEAWVAASWERRRSASIAALSGNAGAKSGPRYLAEGDMHLGGSLAEKLLRGKSASDVPSRRGDEVVQST